MTHDDGDGEIDRAERRARHGDDFPFERAPNTPGRSELPPLTKLVIELGPLVIFFIVNGRTDIFVATAVFVAATLIALSVSYALIRRLPIMPLVSGIVIVTFGGLTLALQDEIFIKLKPTIVNTLFGAILLGGLAFGRPLLGYVLDSVFKLDNAGWYKLTFRWGVFFFVLALINEIVWRSFSTDFWVSFKLFGFMPLTLLFALAQVPLIERHSLENANGKSRPQ